MIEPQYVKLLELYKSAIEHNLKSGDFTKEVFDAKLQLDKFFAQTGKDEIEMHEYLDELEQLIPYVNE